MERRCWVNFQCRGVLLVWMIAGQGPIALAVGVGGGLDIFSLIYLFSFLSPSLWETARYRQKYCLKGPLNPKQPTNLFLNENICCDPSLEPSRREGSNDESQNMLYGVKWLNYSCYTSYLEPCAGGQILSEPNWGFIAHRPSYSPYPNPDYYYQIQLNFNGLNTFGTMKICLRKE